jgi:RNA polymerase sigma factor for flagellar operon FliA
VDSSGDGDDESELFAKYAPIARWIAHKYANGWSLAAEWADVYADASIGVLDAIRHFDPARSITQKAYVFIRARGAAIDGIRQRGYMPRSRTGVDTKRAPLSLDMLRAATIDDGRGAWEPRVHERGYDDVDAAVTVPLLLVHLSRRHRFVVEAYYLAGRSMADIGRELGVTESRVCQIHTQALRQMRAILAE